jgi:hypothetical protein
MSEYSEVIEERDGYRVRLELDDSAERPYDDGAVPILQIDGGYYSGDTAEPFNKQAAGFESAYSRLGECATSSSHHREVFARYLRIFHGAVSVQEWNVGVSREYGYIGFDTAAWRASMGITDTERLAAENYLQEVAAWASGDVYGYIVEKYDADADDWYEITDGASWGFYGDEYASQAAREALQTALASTPKARLEYLRTQIDAECISQGELIELQGLAEHIEPGDVQLLEWAGVPEFPEEPETPSYWAAKLLDGLDHAELLTLSKAIERRLEVNLKHWND